MRFPILLYATLQLLGCAKCHSFNSVSEQEQLIEDYLDCANTTHRWESENGSCFDETGILPPQDLPLPQSNAIGRFLGGIGLSPRDGICGPDETACWVVNCCQPGEICGDITVGCIISWSTIYTTTLSTMWSTITNTITPTLSSTSTLVQTNTVYQTTTTDITLPGSGPETVIETSSTTTTELILSAYTPTVSSTFSTITTTIVRDLDAADVHPASITSSPSLKLRGSIHKRTQRTSYTTLTVYITRFSSLTATATYTGSVATITQVIYTTQTALQTNSHFSTVTGFTTLTVNYTSTFSSFAFGTLDAQTITFMSTRTLTSDLSSTITPSSVQAVQGHPTASTAAGDIKKTHLSAGAIAGIVIGILVIFALLILAILFCCCRRGNRAGAAAQRRQRRYSHRPVTPPLLPEPPLPQVPMSTVPNPTLQRPAPVVINSNGHSSRNGRKSSRSSIVSVSPVPEEADEDEYNSSSPENGVSAPMVRRGSSDSNRSWGHGYGGRGGYGAHGRGGSVYSGNNSPGGNRQFRGVMTSAYKDGTLVPPHERR